MENNELNELVVWKKKFGYSFLIVVFIASVIGSNWYFSMLKEDLASENSSGDKLYSGDILESANSGLHFSGENDFLEVIDSGDFNNNQNNLPDEIIASGEVSNGNEDTDKKDNVISDEKNQDSNKNNDVVVDYYTSNRVLDSNKPMVALTFDDGPDPKRTIKLLEILKKNNSVATFFDIGELMDKYPEVVKKEVEAGCDVGGHTYSHVNLNSLSKSEIEQEITKVENAFKNATGLNLKYIRPTYGNANKTVRDVTKHPIINWCVDSLDWKHRDADKVIEEIRKTKNLDGKIILMHVIYDSTLEAMERLIPELISEGYQLVTISEMAEYKGKTLENGKIYYQF